MEKPDTIASRMRAARKAAALTQVDAAPMIGCDNSTLSKIETGGDRPSVALLIRAAAVYGVPPDSLVPPGDPLATELLADIVSDPLERAWLNAFRAKPPQERAFLLNLIGAMPAA